MKRPRLHWFWRALISVAVGTVCGQWYLSDYFKSDDGVLFPFHVWVGERLLPALGSSESDVLPLWQLGVIQGATVVLPIVLFVLGTYGILTWLLGPKRAHGDGETRCRKCDYILRGITEPRCPECGERI